MCTLHCKKAEPRLRGASSYLTEKSSLLKGWQSVSAQTVGCWWSRRVTGGGWGTAIRFRWQTAEHLQSGVAGHASSRERVRAWKHKAHDIRMHLHGKVTEAFIHASTCDCTCFPPSSLSSSMSVERNVFVIHLPTEPVMWTAITLKVTFAPSDRWPFRFKTSPASNVNITKGIHIRQRRPTLHTKINK